MTILEFLYNTVPGRFLLKSLTGPRLSRICGHFLDSELQLNVREPSINCFFFADRFKPIELVGKSRFVFVTTYSR